jgi:xylulokinase
MFGDTDEPVRRTIAVGGGVKSRVWTQAISDITGHTQLVPAQTIGASYGDAFLAAVAVGRAMPDAIGSWNPVERTVEPADVPAYRRQYPIWKALYLRTSDLAHALAERPT